MKQRCVLVDPIKRLPVSQVVMRSAPSDADAASGAILGSVRIDSLLFGDHLVQRRDHPQYVFL